MAFTFAIRSKRNVSMRAFYALGILTRHGFAAWKSWTNISRNSVPLFRCWMLHAFVRTFGQFRDLVYVTRNEGATMLCVLWSLIRVVAMTLALTHVRRTEEFRKWTNFYSFTQLIWISIEILSNSIERNYVSPSEEKRDFVGFWTNLESRSISF